MFRSVWTRVDRALYERVKRATERAGYASPRELITHAIEERLQAIEQSDSDDTLRQRLRGLGYLG